MYTVEKTLNYFSLPRNEQQHSPLVFYPPDCQGFYESVFACYHACIVHQNWHISNLPFNLSKYFIHENVWRRPSYSPLIKMHICNVR